MGFEREIRAGIFGIAGNALLFLFKLILFFLSGSIAILADSFHTLSDSISSGIMILGIVKSRTPPDREHPYGHGRTEYFVMVFMAIILLYTGYLFAKEALFRIINPVKLNISIYVLLGLFLTIILKEAMALYAFRIYKETGSRIVQVDAWHHRFDTLTSIVVIVSLFFQKAGIRRMDGFAGFIVGSIIVFLGIKFLKESYDMIMGVPPSEKMVEKIKEIALSVGGVSAVHDFIISNVESFPIITFHIEADRNIKLEEAHNIADTVEKKVREKFGGVAIVHVDPASKDEDVKRVKDYLEEEVKNIEEVQDILTVTREKGKIIVEVVFGRNVREGKKGEIKEKLKKEILENCSAGEIEFFEKPGFLHEK